jgi:hypothetical protein
MERTFEEFSGKHQRESDGVWFDYTATVEVIDGTPGARARVTRVDTKEHWDISINITPTMSTAMPALVLAAKLWVRNSIDKRAGVDG